MDTEQSQRAAARLAAKRAAVLRPRSHRKRLAVALLTVTLVVGTAALLVARMLPDQAPKPVAGAMFGYVSEQGEVTYPLADFSDGTARFYQHKADRGVIVRYFIQRSGDGTVNAALDACAECWREARGHRQEGPDIVCSNCDKRFPLATLSDGPRDPCVPIPLPATVDAGQVAVTIPDLLAAAKYFKKPYGGL